MIDFVNVLKQAVNMGASDIHVVIGNPPMVRVRGEMTLPRQSFGILVFYLLENNVHKQVLLSMMFLHGQLIGRFIECH